MTRPLAYVCSPTQGNKDANVKRAKAYCRKLYELGYMPVSPLLLFPQFLDAAIPSEREAAQDMARALLRRARLVVVCGGRITADMAAEMHYAQDKHKVTAMLDGLTRPCEYLRTRPEAGTQGDAKRPHAKPHEF